jgi:hypothetical protein
MNNEPIGGLPHPIPHCEEANMVARSADGIVHTEPIETPVSSTGASHSSPAVCAIEIAKEDDPWSIGWNQWARSHVNVLRQEMLDGVGDALGMVRRDIEDQLVELAKRIKDLELKLAEAVGALNVLRGKEAPGSFNVRGTFEPDTVYNYLDVVAFNGSSWIATRDRPGDLPGPGWQLLSSAGKRGPPGAPGKDGGSCSRRAVGTARTARLAREVNAASAA